MESSKAECSLVPLILLWVFSRIDKVFEVMITDKGFLEPANFHFKNSYSFHKGVLAQISSYLPFPSHHITVIGGFPALKHQSPGQDWQGEQTLFVTLSQEHSHDRTVYIGLSVPKLGSLWYGKFADILVKKMEEILRRIEAVIAMVVRSIAEDVSPVLIYPSTSAWRDTEFDMDKGLCIKGDNQRLTSVKFESLPSVKKFGLMMKVLSIMYRLVKTNHYCTKRDIYYQDPDLFVTQNILDGIVDNLSCMLNVPRWDLHVLATSKGCIAGDLIFQDSDNNYIDCRHTQMNPAQKGQAWFSDFTLYLEGANQGIQVPNHVQGMHNIITNADFILVVEKDATFQKLLDAKMCEKLHPCIIVTGKGFPDMNTRLLLRRLWDSFSIPILALVDADPHGIEIMAIYKFGSRSLSFETSHLAVPSMKWLGILPTDLTRLGIPEHALIPLSQADCDRGRELLTRPYMPHFPQWRREVEELLKLQKKAEIQSLDSISSNFLYDVYIPSKIRYSGWI